MITFPNAKINLGLDIVEKRPDGYHNLESLFYPIPIHDILEITVSDDESGFTMYNATFEGDEKDNLVVKAYNLLAKEHALPKARISLYKNIPTGAGMGGGSSDAAFTLKMLNEIASLRLSDEQLEEYAAKIGADCAFFIKNKPAFATGIGNVLVPVDFTLKGYHIAVVKPDIHVSTKEAYSLVSPAYPEKPLKEIIMKPVEEWKEDMKNDFEKSIFAKHPSVAGIKKNLYSMGAVYASMSGSGSSFFGIFKNEPDANALERQFAGMYCKCMEM